MRILHSGFAGVAQHTITSTEAPTLQFGDSKGASNRQLVSGGWGYVGAITQGLLHLHGGQSTVSCCNDHYTMQNKGFYLHV